MADYLVQEDGFRINLEDGTGSLLLEAAIQARVSQLPAEVAIEPTSAQARVSQTAVEVGYQGVPKGRVSQLVVEVAVMQLHESSHVVIIDPSLKDAS